MSDWPKTANNCLRSGDRVFGDWRGTGPAAVSAMSRNAGLIPRYSPGIRNRLRYYGNGRAGQRTGLTTAAQCCLNRTAERKSVFLSSHFCAGLPCLPNCVSTTPAQACTAVVWADGHYCTAHCAVARAAAATSEFPVYLCILMAGRQAAGGTVSRRSCRARPVLYCYCLF